jgi:hypothetical protein
MKLNTIYSAETAVDFERTTQRSVPEYVTLSAFLDRLCRLVVRVLGYGSGGRGFDSRHYKKVVGLERGPLSLVSTTEELTE